MLSQAKKDSARAVPEYKSLQDERGGALLGFPYRVQHPRKVKQPTSPLRPYGLTGDQTIFSIAGEAVAATCGTNTVCGWQLYSNAVLDEGMVVLEYGRPLIGANCTVLVAGSTILNNAAEEQPIAHAPATGEDDVVEFRLLPPRVETIASLRNKVRLNKVATDFVKGVRAHAFRVEEDVEEQSE